MCLSAGRHGETRMTSRSLRVGRPATMQAPRAGSTRSAAERPSSRVSSTTASSWRAGRSARPTSTRGSSRRPAPPADGHCAAAGVWAPRRVTAFGCGTQGSSAKRRPLPADGLEVIVNSHPSGESEMPPSRSSPAGFTPFSTQSNRSRYASPREPELRSPERSRSATRRRCADGPYPGASQARTIPADTAPR